MRAPVTRISDKTLAWILIRHAAPFLHRADINCVQLLLWSQVNTTTVVRSSQFLYIFSKQSKTLSEVKDRVFNLTQNLTVDGKKFSPPYLGDFEIKRKILGKDDLADALIYCEDDIEAEKQECDDKTFQLIDMIKQR